MAQGYAARPSRRPPTSPPTATSRTVAQGRGRRAAEHASKACSPAWRASRRSRRWRTSTTALPAGSSAARSRSWPACLCRAHRERRAGGPQRRGQDALAIALGYRATQAGIKTRFTTAADLLLTLVLAHAQQPAQERDAAGDQRLPAVDHRRDRLPADEREQANLFFQVIAARYERGQPDRDQQSVVRAVGQHLRPGRDADGGAAGSAAASRPHRADQRRELPAETPAQGRDGAIDARRCRLRAARRCAPCGRAFGPPFGAHHRACQ
jgi:hypothetical protein